MIQELQPLFPYNIPYTGRIVYFQGQQYMEYIVIPGTVRMNTVRRLKWQQFHKLARMIVTMNSIDIVHGDISEGNVLIDLNLKPVLIDWQDTANIIEPERNLDDLYAKLLDLADFDRMLTDARFIIPYEYRAFLVIIKNYEGGVQGFDRDGFRAYITPIRNFGYLPYEIV